MVVKITIQDKTDHIVFQDQFADDSKFYLGLIDKAGQYKSFGRLPKKKIFLNFIHKSAQEWAKEQDLNGFFQELRNLLIDISIKESNIQAQLFFQADSFHFDADELRSLLMEVKQVSAIYFQQAYGREGGYVLFNLVWEIMLAMVRRLEEENRKVHTVWEYPALPLGENEVKVILEWLFRRVENGRNN